MKSKFICLFILFSLISMGFSTPASGYAEYDYELKISKSIINASSEFTGAGSIETANLYYYEGGELDDGDLAYTHIGNYKNDDGIRDHSDYTLSGMAYEGDYLQVVLWDENGNDVLLVITIEFYGDTGGSWQGVWSSPDQEDQVELGGVDITTDYALGYGLLEGEIECYDEPARSHVGASTDPCFYDAGDEYDWYINQAYVEMKVTTIASGSGGGGNCYVSSCFTS